MRFMLPGATLVVLAAVVACTQDFDQFAVDDSVVRSGEQLGTEDGTDSSDEAASDATDADETASDPEVTAESEVGDETTDTEPAADEPDVDSPATDPASASTEDSVDVTDAVVTEMAPVETEGTPVDVAETDVVEPVLQVADAGSSQTTTDTGEAFDAGPPACSFPACDEPRAACDLTCSRDQDECELTCTGNPGECRRVCRDAYDLCALECLRVCDDCYASEGCSLGCTP